ncbi:hypothetical protein [Staphylococcus pseudintermedius]|uniref:hypothetical protein n=1 Tax=Staphylococcus pseudintermedius TaxID=283734 RepID=UPI00286E2A9B|nr:hypothetical protein [Staphylococcus pseudintermedius]WMZ54913.1 hypothetical protein QS425_11665 [Staphylococcus pseudintermedius]
MLKIRTPDFEIGNRHDFSLQEMMGYTEKMEAKEFSNIPESFDYILYDEEKDTDIIETTYKLNDGYNNIYEHAKELLKNVQVDSEDMKSIKRHYLKKLDEVARDYKAQKQTNRKKINNTPKKTTYNAKKQNRENSYKESIVSQLKGKKGIGVLLLVLLVIGICYLFIATDPNNGQKKDNVEKEDIYQQALLGQEDKAIKNFEKLPKEEMTKNDKSIYANLLIDKEDFDKAVEIKNEKYVENELYTKGKFDLLEKFESKHSTRNGQFDLAIYKEKYEDAIQLVDDIDKTPERKKALAIAYIESDQLDKAKKLAASTDDEEVTKMIEDKQRDKQQALEKDVEDKQKEYDKVKDDKKKKKEAKDTKEALDNAKDKLEQFKNDNK